MFGFTEEKYVLMDNKPQLPTCLISFRFKRRKSFILFDNMHAKYLPDELLMADVLLNIYALNAYFITE